MAKVAVSIKIDVSKIDKARLFKGEKGVYLDATAFIDLDQQGKYGDNGMVAQDVTKEEREANVKGAILGNVKVFWKDYASDSSAREVPKQEQAASEPPSAFQFDDDLPW